MPPRDSLAAPSPPPPATVPPFNSLSYATFGQGWGHMCQTHPEQMSPPGGAKQREEQSIDSSPSDLCRTNHLCGGGEMWVLTLAHSANGNSKWVPYRLSSCTQWGTPGLLRWSPVRGSSVHPFSCHVFFVVCYVCQALLQVLGTRK